MVFKKRKVNKRHRSKRSPNMARKKRFSRARGAGKAGLGSLRKGKIGEGLKGVGAADIVDDITDRFAPQWSAIARPIAGYAAGGIIGAVAVIAKDLLVGQKIPAGSQLATSTGGAI